jgi:poly(3-hydroxybutyrate) depolymerase
MAPLALASVLAAAALVCPRGLTVVEDACVVQPAPGAPVVVYFHGMLPGDTDWRHVRELKLLAREARRRGFGLVALRGEQGLCQWSKEVHQHWCWPSDLSQLKDVGRTLDRLARVLAQVPAAGAPVFAGFSNGGYLTAMIASETDVAAAGYVVMHAGNVSGEEFPLERAKPVLVMGASRDPIQLPIARRFAAKLEDAQWPVNLTVRRGVHEVTAEDARRLFDFVAGL